MKMILIYFYMPFQKNLERNQLNISKGYLGVTN